MDELKCPACDFPLIVTAAEDDDELPSGYCPDCGHEEGRPTGIESGQVTTVDEFTEEETRAIRSLERLAKKWPASLTLLSWSGSLMVFHTEDVRSGRGLRSALGHTVYGISNDGGDPD
ncbi:hypothetical protein [Rhodococcus sp. BS-15]|uniref:hypothetical protein n=1 Tax=Rhodococcus sp. BS-15 TaxID=1304954 RepID=UPI0011AE4182|nr:hypothetical protein [Rhodococcus sp. BS-15]